MRHVAVVLTARPSFARIKSVLDACMAHPELELTVVPAASAMLSRTGAVADELSTYPTVAGIQCVIEGGTALSSVKTTGLLAIELGHLFHAMQPDVVITIADRHETMATAIAATYQNIPLAHLQGGEITGNIDNRVRHTITQMADLHFVATSQAAENVTRTRGSSRGVYQVGCPSIDIAHKSTGPRMHPSDPYVLIINHPETEHPDEAYSQMRHLLKAVKETGLTPYVVSPGADSGAPGVYRALQEASLAPIERMSPEETYRLLKSAVCIVGNSSLGIREAGALGVWAVNCGIRQHGRERAENVIDVPYKSDVIRDAVKKAHLSDRPPKSILYGDGKSGHRIAQHLARWNYDATHR